MLTLALETSAKAASAALGKDGTILAHYYQNTGLTHSRTLLPMAEDLLKNTGYSASDLELVAVACGPGSFTGVRIGIAAVKGLCFALDIPACGVSTLEAMARACSFSGSGTVCAVMDARRSEVYNALFRFEGGAFSRLCPDRALSMEKLMSDIAKYPDPPLIIGDGAEIFYNYLQTHGKYALIAPEHLRNQNAVGVYLASLDTAHVEPALLAPFYLRPSQAERERLEKQGQA